ncbi:MAG: hypothetical protein FWD71_18770 [Oscillospiraceae bacterium]|nr:hypothetical protein [Oscillospiraceae bacterium]
MDIKVKKCEICDDEFETYFSHQKYCKKCGKDPYKAKQEYEWAAERLDRHAGWDYVPKIPDKKHICLTCGKEFLSIYENGGNCDVCKKVNKDNKKRIRCKFCRNLLKTNENTEYKDYCNAECKQKRQAKIEEERIARARIRGDYRNCKWCGKSFIRRDYFDFCSNKCSKLYDKSL